jgi:regulator of extracellular matrix RemA (YlzA/DUF370 family)
MPAERTDPRSVAVTPESAVVDRIRSARRRMETRDADFGRDTGNAPFAFAPCMIKMPLR